MKRICLGILLIMHCITGSDTPHTVINNNNSVSITISNEVIQNIQQALMQPLHHASDAAHRLSSSLLQHIDAAYGWACEHPILTTGASVGICHIALNIYGSWLSRSLRDSECWSMWKYHLSNEELEQIPMQTLGHNLTCEIQRRYTDKQKPHAFAEPLITFANTIASEYRMLHHYKYICNLLSTLCLSRVSWYDQHLYDCIDIRIQRLDIIWHIFISWLAEYKVGEA